MVQLTDEMKDLLKSSLCYVATASPDGVPCVSPKSCRFSDEGELYYTEWAGRRTYANILANPRVAISTCSADRRTSYRFEGTARALTSGPLFETEAARRREKGKTPAVAVVMFEIAAVYNMSKPDPGGRAL